MDCRSAALLFAATLREHGLPARIRFGFAEYLTPTHWQSHVVCGHHGAGGWTRTDPDLGRFGLTRQTFLDATEAWHADPAQQQLFGYGPTADLRGPWTVRRELLRDLAALTGFEPLTSDSWGIVDRDDTDGSTVFAEIAAATTHTERLVVAANPEVAVPRTITTRPYLTGREYRVDLVADGSLKNSKD